jgi:hypothetical protein
MTEDQDDPKSARTRLRWLDPNHKNVKRSKKQEERIAKTFGGRRLPRSGGKAWSRSDESRHNREAYQIETKTDGGDVVAPEFLIEHKLTRTKSYSLHRDTLAKVTEGAEARGKTPLVVVTFEHTTRKLEDWAVIPMEALQKLLALRPHGTKAE